MWINQMFFYLNLEQKLMTLRKRCDIELLMTIPMAVFMDEATILTRLMVVEDLRKTEHIL